MHILKKMSLIASLTAIFICVTLVIAITLSNGTPPASSVQQAKDVPQYVLASYDSRVAVFRYGSSSPQKVYDVYIDSLPDFDRQQLTKGIEVKNSEVLAELIEDYTS